MERIVNTGPVLVVDDDPGWRLLISDELKEAGYDVRLAGTLDEARQCLQQEQIALVVLDVLFGMGRVLNAAGLDFAREIRENDNLKHIPIVFCTVVARGDLAQKLERMKGDAVVIVKPFNFHQLSSVVRDTLRKARPKTVRPGEGA